jgi:hypothetical protein
MDYFGIYNPAGESDFNGDTVPSKLNTLRSSNSLPSHTGPFLTGEDLDGEGATLPITVTWSGIDISGVTNMEFSGEFSHFQGVEKYDRTDYITVRWDRN